MFIDVPNVYANVLLAKKNKYKWYPNHLTFKEVYKKSIPLVGCNQWFSKELKEEGDATFIPLPYNSQLVSSNIKNETSLTIHKQTKCLQMTLSRTTKVESKVLVFKNSGAENNELWWRIIYTTRSKVV